MSLPESAPLATRTRSRMPNVPTSEELPVPSRRRRANVDSTTPSPSHIVPMTKKGPPIGQKKSSRYSLGAIGGSASGRDGDGYVR
jgi:hypothetical protein